MIVHSSDLDEVLELADRLFVMASGVLTELPIALSAIMRTNCDGLPTAWPFTDRTMSPGRRPA